MERSRFRWFGGKGALALLLLTEEETIMETRQLVVLVLSGFAFACSRPSARPLPGPTDSGTDSAPDEGSGDAPGDIDASWDSVSEGLGLDWGAADIAGGPAGEAGGALDAVIADADVEAGKADGFSSSIDTAPDGVAAIPCSQLNAAWSAYVASNRACSTVADCRVVGGAGTCNCTPVLGNGSGVAISVSAQGNNDYFSRLMVCTQQGYNVGSICDAAPARNLRCENGLCTADEASCLAQRG